MPASDPILASVDLWPVPFVPMGWLLCNGQLLQIQQNSALYSLLGTFYGGDGKTTFGIPNLCGRVAIGAGQTAVPVNPTLTTYQLAQFGGLEKVQLLVTECAVGLHNHPATVTDATYSAAVTDPTYTANVTDPVYSASGSGTVTPKAGTGKVTLVADPTNNFPGQATSNIYTSANNAVMGSSPVSITVNINKTTGGSVAINKTTGGSVALNKATSGSVAVGNNQASASQTAHENRMPFLALYYIIATEGIYPQRQ